jgi:hypothetical protein
MKDLLLTMENLITFIQAIAQIIWCDNKHILQTLAQEVWGVVANIKEFHTLHAIPISGVDMKKPPHANW